MEVEVKGEVEVEGGCGWISQWVGGRWRVGVEQN